MYSTSFLGLSTGVWLSLITNPSRRHKSRRPRLIRAKANKTMSWWKKSWCLILLPSVSALVEAIEANKILLQFAEESRKSLEDTKTKLKEFETREEALKAKLTTVESYAKALQ
ncbi:hypothetical protein JHK85_004668 [Glycine max]|nr:hypothetical protein JHK85_004668 [Glycine max]